MSRAVPTSQLTATTSTTRSNWALAGPRPANSMVRPRAPLNGTVSARATAVSRRSAGRTAPNQVTAIAPASTAMPRMLAAVWTTSAGVVGS